MARYIDAEKAVKAQNEIVKRMQEFIDEYKKYSKSTIDYFGGKYEAMEVGMRLVKSVLSDLIEQPTKDVEEVKYGCWEKVGVWGDTGSVNYRCTACGETTFDSNYFVRCPKCGAKMSKYLEECFYEIDNDL